MTTATETKKPAVRVRIEYDELAISPRDPTYCEMNSEFGDWHRQASPGDEKIKDFEDVLVKVSNAGEPEQLSAWYDREEDRMRARFGLSWTQLWDGHTTPDQKASFRDLRVRLREKQIALAERYCVFLPVYLLDHTNVKYQTMPFGVDWDSGQVGFIWIDRAGIKAQWNWTVLTKARRDRIKASLECEIEIYSQYASGDCYYVVLEDEDGEEVDSFGGTFGTDWDTNGIKDGIPKHLHYHTKWKMPWR